MPPHQTTLHAHPVLLHRMSQHLILSLIVFSHTCHSISFASQQDTAAAFSTRTTRKIHLKRSSLRGPQGRTVRWLIAFTQRRFYTQKPLRAEGRTNSMLYTEKLLHRKAFTHRKLLHRASFYTDKILHTASFLS